MMTTAQHQFLELLKAGLWNTSADPSMFQKENVDWAGILRIAKEQTVPIIIADGIETLPNELWPSKDAMLKLMMTRVKTTQMHHLTNATINQIANALEPENIQFVLLKGQGVAKNYNKPESRTCGDIDLYVGESNYAKACQIIEYISNTQESRSKCIESDHHMHMRLNEIEVEVHRKADYMPGAKMNAALQDWSKESLDSNFGSGDLLKWDNAGTTIYTGPATFDAFFILHHAVRHMTVGGIGFRQLCDLTMYLHRYHTCIDTALLKEKLKTFKMTEVWNEFGILLVNTLGLPAAEFPLAPDKPISSKTEKILQQIFISGNFGHADKARKDRRKVSYIKKKWRDFSFQSTRLIMLFKIFPKYSFAYAARWVSEGLLRLVCHK